MKKPSPALIVATAALGVATMGWLRNPLAQSPRGFSGGTEFISTPQLHPPAPENSDRAVWLRADDPVLPQEYAHSSKSLRHSAASAVTFPANRSAAETSLRRWTSPPTDVASPEPAVAPSRWPGLSHARPDTGPASVSLSILPGTPLGMNPAPKQLNAQLDRGVQMPMALLEMGETLTTAQAVAMKQISDAFALEINDVATAAPQDSTNVEKVWENAREWANLQYQLLYGDEAFNRASINAGLDALAGE